MQVDNETYAEELQSNGVQIAAVCLAAINRMTLPRGREQVAMRDESVEERVEYLTDEKAREILVRVINTLIAEGSGLAVSDVLAEHCLLTNAECLQIYRSGQSGMKF
jgi:hypothetical protein